MAAIDPFVISRLPRIVFGAGAADSVAEQAAAFGGRALVVTGARSLRAMPFWRRLREGLDGNGMAWESFVVAGEPSPDLIDEAVAQYRDAAFDLVIGIGGGSAMDAAKAIAGLLGTGNSVIDHLEGVGPEIPYQGPAVPFIAVPTTAGTGSEATKNAVLSRPGEEGFKKSFRDEALVAKLAIVDPALLESCPPTVLAANGMDAFTQLLESYVSIRANPLTEALAWSGMEAFGKGFFTAWQGDGESAAAGRSQIAYASLMSGICLAQTGLGSVHGLAQPLGAFFSIPHGVVCGTLVAEASEVNFAALLEREPDSPALDKYHRVAGLLVGQAFSDRDEALDTLVKTLRMWTEKLSLPRLGAYGVNETHMEKIVAGSRGSSMKTNPIVLADREVAEIVSRRL